jgi:hypothetical protein
MRIVNAGELEALLAGSFGLPAAATEKQLVKHALRRGAFLLAPCSAADLVTFVVEPLAMLGDIREATEDALAELIAYGDILEMRRLDSDAWDAPTLALRPAPPSFVMRGKHEAILVGVSGELPSPLTAELAEQVTEEGPVRVLRSGNEHLEGHLRLLGLVQLQENVWLRTPSAEMALTFLGKWIDKLDSGTDLIGSVEDLEILDPTKSPRFYPGRWRQPAASDNGHFVARRGQVYGGKIWCLVRLRGGQPIKLLDLIADGNRQRPCDIAWRIEAAIDASRGDPQAVVIRKVGSNSRLEFSGPIPSFAERHLALAGSKITGEGYLFAFQMDDARAEKEADQLQRLLWMKKSREVST